MGTRMLATVIFILLITKTNMLAQLECQVITLIRPQQVEEESSSILKVLSSRKERTISQQLRPMVIHRLSEVARA